MAEVFLKNQIEITMMSKNTRHAAGRTYLTNVGGSWKPSGSLV